MRQESSVALRLTHSLKGNTAFTIIIKLKTYYE